MSNTKHSETTKPPIPIYLSGAMPRGTWCATCVMLYQGAMGADEEFKKWVMEKHTEAMRSGQDFVIIEMPERDDMMLQLAITVGPSTYFTAPMPVCWTHSTGYRLTSPEEQAAGKPRLIEGKSYTKRVS